MVRPCSGPPAGEASKGHQIRVARHVRQTQFCNRGDWYRYRQELVSRRGANPVELLAEVPIAASLGRIGPIPAKVDRRRRRHSIGGDDDAQSYTVKDGAVVGALDPRPHGPHDRGGFHSHSAAPDHRNMGPTGCDASMSNRDVPGSNRDALVAPRCRTTT